MPRQRRVLALASLLVTLAAPAAHAARPEGAPHTLRTARPADHVVHAGKAMERWRLRALDPRGLRAIDLQVGRYLGEIRYRFELKDERGFEDVVEGGALGGIAADGRRLEATAAGVLARVVPGPSGASVELATPGVSGRLTLAHARRGPAALGFRMGMTANGAYTGPTDWNWTVPIARASVRGGLNVGGMRVPMDGWLVSYEHGWGNRFEVFDTSHDFADSRLVHRGGATWISHGLNRTDTVTGPGARDAQWLGLLARVTRGGVRVCRPRIDRRRWGYRVLPFRIGSADVLAARCGGLRARFTAAPYEVDARVDGRGRGWIERIRTQYQP